jgi:hypothetical protein
MNRLTISRTASYLLFLVLMPSDEKRHISDQRHQQHISNINNIHHLHHQQYKPLHTILQYNTMTSSTPAVSGMALSIRKTVDMDTFDLGGQSVATIQTLVRDAFGSPLVSQTVPRITLVTGAGKLGRQKYDASAAKTVVTGLLEFGYVEDRGASAILSCAGTFKSQHDTAKNLKTVVVFPKLSGNSGNDSNNNNNNGLEGNMGDLSLGNTSTTPILDPSSPEYKIVMATTKHILEAMLESKCPSWSQKKHLLQVLDELLVLLQASDQKLMTGTVLTATEQDFYDAVSAQSLTNKQDVIRELMHVHVDKGNITKSERTLLLHQVQERLDAIDKEEAAATGKPKLLAKLEQKRHKAVERQEKIQAIVPAPPAPLKNQPQINKLRTEAVPLKKVQDAAAGRLLSVKESQVVSKLQEILVEIEELEQASRGWFEDEDAFDARLAASRRIGVSASKSASKKTGKTASSAATPRSGLPTSAKWVTPGSATAAAKKKAAASKPKTARGGGVFGAMMMDSDSD